jgi:hypothetical protein
MQLTSPAFDKDQAIPPGHTVKGAAVSPPLTISEVPPAAQSLALIVHDPDAPGHDFTHWLVWNISATTTVWPEGQIPTGALQGMTDYGRTGYGPPAPPSGTHRYVFDLYALNTQLSLKAGSRRQDLEAALAGHIIGQAQLVGTVSA